LFIAAVLSVTHGWYSLAIASQVCLLDYKDQFCSTEAEVTSMRQTVATGCTEVAGGAFGGFIKVYQSISCVDGNNDTMLVNFHSDTVCSAGNTFSAGDYKQFSITGCTKLSQTQSSILTSSGVFGADKYYITPLCGKCPPAPVGGTSSSYVSDSPYSYYVKQTFVMNNFIGDFQEIAFKNAIAFALDGYNVKNTSVTIVAQQNSSATPSSVQPQQAGRRSPWALSITYKVFMGNSDSDAHSAMLYLEQFVGGRFPAVLQYYSTAPVQMDSIAAEIAVVERYLNGQPTPHLGWAQSSADNTALAAIVTFIIVLFGCCICCSGYLYYQRRIEQELQRKKGISDLQLESVELTSAAGEFIVEPVEGKDPTAVRRDIESQNTPASPHAAPHDDGWVSEVIIDKTPHSRRRKEQESKSMTSKWVTDPAITESVMTDTSQLTPRMGEEELQAELVWTDK